MKFRQLIEHTKTNDAENEAGKLVPDRFFVLKKTLY